MMILDVPFLDFQPAVVVLVNHDIGDSFLDKGETGLFPIMPDENLVLIVAKLIFGECRCHRVLKRLTEFFLDKVADDLGLRDGCGGEGHGGHSIVRVSIKINLG